jgi:phage shock protein PspC (stress-responsive transcriptional regulator)
MNRLERRIRRRLLRDPENGWLGGICEGIARATSLPATGVRIGVAVMALLFTTPTLVAYAAAWLFMDSREEALPWKHSRN